jgi:hypothetical protein
MLGIFKRGKKTPLMPEKPERFSLTHSEDWGKEVKS